MKKRMLSALVILCLVLALLPTFALADIARTDEAAIGNTGYATLADALAAARSGNTVTLLTNAASDALAIPAGVTLDGGGYTLTLSTRYAVPAFLTVSAGDVTIQNITIDANGKAQRAVGFYRCDGGTLKSAVVYGGSYSAVLVDGATGVTLESCILCPDDNAYACVEYAMSGQTATIPSVKLSNVAGSGTAPLVYASATTVQRVIKNSKAETVFEALDLIHEKVDGVTMALTQDGEAVAFQLGGLLWAAVTDHRGGFSTDIGQLPFGDVTVNDWFAYPVAYVHGHDIMQGTEDYKFSPNASLTRAMVAQIVYNLAGQPAAGRASFTDVPSNAWYAAAVNWAAAAGIVNGYEDGRFAPNESVTREQLASILYRYAQYRGEDVSVTAPLTFTDSGKVRSFAVPAVKWAVGIGVLSGKGDGLLDPSGTATRAEAAKMLQCFDEWY